ncbi:undecaprenyl-phosphate glucose phosphotransferase [Litoribacter ruber]|uniref:Undecaprenyl-phosphate glucose phosphotransferase n=1 Tax=Litoribacter ruber TaxID=702568 RepID=A0AAP2CGJ6_9BACT|nr:MULTISPECIES: undecaprenyl-phosphate glucose phosphotransferase [Litoribacter]MBS9524248.1 undecaprenyl-phosphate glucose phosphotransferase [Litoribacter alkaliphilus]MBT0809954.1 undecaprenyl-phosphate glucose phosphotransferase [Litoribacter ruber]
MSRSEKILATFFFIWDIITLMAAFALSVAIFQEELVIMNEWMILAGVLGIWFIIGYWRKLYNLKVTKTMESRPFRYLKAYFILIAVVAFLYHILSFPSFERNIILAFSLGFPVLGFTSNFFINNIVNRINQNRNVKHTLVAGVGNAAANVYNYYKSNPSKYAVKGFIKCKKEETFIEQDKIVGDVDNLNDILCDNEVDEIVIAIPVKPSKKIKKIMQAADYHGKRVRYIPDYSELFGKNYKSVKYGEMDSINTRQMPLDETSSYVAKEFFDLFFSTMALIFLSPLLLIVAALIKLDSPGPILYCPLRIGKNGKPFRVFKFRTMKECDATGNKSTQENDPRITRVGKYLRKYSIDELPQFLNVFFGDMSVVGPRPHRSQLNQQFQESTEQYMLRHYFKPGITGWAQVNGWRGPTNTLEQKQQRTSHDLWYIENWSFILDIKIIYMTIFGKKTHSSAF